MPNELLVDAHCHFFNIDDIPIYQFMERLEISLRMRAAAALAPTAMIRNALRDHKSFFVFFESSRAENIVRTVDEYYAAFRASSLGSSFDERLKVMTPLIMDFEPSQPHERLRHQTRALLNAIKEAEDHLPSDVKILPFIGLSMQRLNDVHPEEAPEWIDSFLHDELEGALRPAAERKDVANLANGDVIGVKLYPPLGFDPYPSDTRQRDTYIAAYGRLAAHALPFTVHCQPTGYALVAEHERWTNPENWAGALSHDPQLRINFAHFGGDEDLAQTVKWRQEKQRCFVSELNEQTWTYAIIKLLKTHPNTYADISALNWTSFDTCINFRALLTIDENDAFGEMMPTTYRLADKLLWGSDYPMTLGREKTYQQLLERFVASFRRKIRMATLYDLREFAKQPDPENILAQITDSNPRRFLFG